MNSAILIVAVIVGILMEVFNCNFLFPLILTAFLFVGEYFFPGVFSTTQSLLLWIGYGTSLSVRKEYDKKMASSSSQDKGK